MIARHSNTRCRFTVRHLMKYKPIIEETPSGRLVVDSTKSYGEVGLLHPNSHKGEDFIL